MPQNKKPLRLQSVAVTVAATQAVTVAATQAATPLGTMPSFIVLHLGNRRKRI